MDYSNYYLREADGTIRRCRSIEDIEASNKHRHLAETQIGDSYLVSTVFLCIDHAFGGGPPMLFETMVFSGNDVGEDIECLRATTEQQARDNHQLMVEKYDSFRDICPGSSAG